MLYLRNYMTPWPTDLYLLHLTNWPKFSTTYDLLTYDPWPNDGVDEVEGGHGEAGAVFGVLLIVAVLNQLMKVTLRRLRCVRDVLEMDKRLWTRLQAKKLKLYVKQENNNLCMEAEM